MVLFSAGMLTSSVVTITQQTLVHRVSKSTVHQETPDSLPIPAVTLCAGHFFSRPSAERLNVSARMAAYLSTTASGFISSDDDPPDVAQLRLETLEAELQELLRRSELTLPELFDQLSPSCEDTVSSCRLGRRASLNGSECCGRLLRAVYTPLGRCWTTLGTDIRQSMAGARFGLHLVLQNEAAPADMDFSELHIDPPSDELRVVATNHYTPPAFAVMNRAVMAAVGQEVKLQVWKEEHDITAERTPLLGGPADCQPVPLAAEPPPAAVAGAASCMVHELLQLYADSCGCRHLGMDVLESESPRAALPICTPQQTLCCAADQVQQMLANASHSSIACRPACVSDWIRVTSTYEHRPVEDANTTAFTIFYSEVVFTRVSAVVPGFLYWYQGVGGVAGLFFGMSVLSLGELLVFVAAVGKEFLRLLTGAPWTNRNQGRRRVHNQG
ncbi:hypothetical protein FJT64_018055 [Amphibalanus amphitrite]|uniref:Uncharacterized protein n=1 Tax=Amphibalanus amphitrite TaxID=1232801 RepID=A0A6A4WW47_AMPAM|nr:hypothetical protein FJT64_018055 [Amphibalanus amphitrite]